MVAQQGSRATPSGGVCNAYRGDDAFLGMSIACFNPVTMRHNGVMFHIPLDELRTYHYTLVYSLITGDSAIFTYVLFIILCERLRRMLIFFDIEIIFRKDWIS